LTSIGTPGGAGRLLLAGGNVWDGTDSAPQPADLVLEDGVVQAVGHGLDADASVDVSGLTALPGFIDCHVHVAIASPDFLGPLRLRRSYRALEIARHLTQTLEAGVTTVRDAGGADGGVRDAVRDGVVAGPRMLVSVQIISQTGGHGDFFAPCGLDLSPLPPDLPRGVVDGPDRMRQAVREMIRAGADVIKVATTGGVLSPDDDPLQPQLHPDELEVLAYEASVAGRKWMAHAQSPAGIKNALRAGAASIEHGILLDDECIELLLETGAYLVPTLAAPLGVIEAAERGMPVPAASLRKAHEVAELHAESFRRAVQAGVSVAMGTDSGVVPHGQNLRELALMESAGMPAPAVLQAATSGASQLLGLESTVGRLQPGYAADIALVEGDAFTLDGLGKRVRQVWQQGRRVR
jgi:imidazolonepropionase-like amidohydrolase